jgi:hypothetical protein
MVILGSVELGKSPDRGLTLSRRLHLRGQTCITYTKQQDTMIHFAIEIYLSDFTSLCTLNLKYWSGRSDKE